MSWVLHHRCMFLTGFDVVASRNGMMVSEHSRIKIGGSSSTSECEHEHHHSQENTRRGCVRRDNRVERRGWPWMMAVLGQRDGGSRIKL